MNNFRSMIANIKEFIIRHKYMFFYVVVTLLTAYLFSSQRKIHVKNDFEINVELDSSVVRDGMYIQQEPDSIIIEKLDSALMMYDNEN